MGVVASEPLSDGAVVLSIQASPNRYSFAFTGSDGTQHRLATGEVRYLAPQVAGGFTGVCFAMYTSGNASPDAAPAFFDWFD